LSIAGLGGRGVKRRIAISPENAAGTRLMTLWFVFALMTAAAIFAVLLPLGLGGRLQAGGREAVVYGDQLQEIDRDVASGLIGKAEAEAARSEIGRRLLAVADQDAVAALRPSMPWRRAAAGLALVGLPLLAVGIYLPLGSPRLGDFPLALRSRAPDAAQPLEALVNQVEQHLEKNPTDGRGWNVLAPVLLRSGPFATASPIMATVLNDGQISAKPLRRRQAALSRPRRRPSSSVRWRSMPMT
jgi:cytochrome c-type biogenesis protein CcmI